MATSKAATVEEYLNELPEERRAVVAAVREMIVHYLPAGYQESMDYGTISYVIPLERYPNTHNGRPLACAVIAAQKNHYAIHLLCAYMNPERAMWLKEQFALAGKKLDMGKGCLRFRKLEDLAVPAIGEVIAGTTVDQYIAQYEATRNGTPASA